MDQFQQELEKKRQQVLGKNYKPLPTQTQSTGGFADNSFQQRRMQILKQSTQPKPQVTQPTVKPIQQPKQQDFLQQAESGIGSFFKGAEKIGGDLVSSITNAFGGKKKTTQPPSIVDDFLNIPLGKDKSVGGFIKWYGDQVNSGYQSLAGESTAYAPSSKKNLQQLYSQRIQTIKTQPVQRLTHDATNAMLGLLSGTNLVKNPVKSLTPEDLFIKPISQIAGSTAMISGIGGVVDKMLGAGSLGSFLNSTKKLRFMKGILSNVTSMDIYGQLDPTLKDRLNELKNDSIYGTLNGLLEPIGKVRYSAPISFAAGVGMATMNGADPKSAFVNGLIMAALDASGKLVKKPGETPQTETTTQPIKTEQPTYTSEQIKNAKEEELYQAQSKVQEYLKQNPEDQQAKTALNDITSELDKRKMGQIDFGSTREPLKTTSTGEAGLPSEETARTLPSTVETVKRSPSKTYSPSTEAVLRDPSFITKYNSTIAEKPYLVKLIDEVSSGRKTTVDEKNMETAAEKIVRKQQTKPSYNENDLGDLIRGNIVANSTEDAQKILSNLQNKANVTTVENYLDKPTAWGYSGINVNIKTPEGNTAEIQIHTPESIAVQTALHPLYEKWRNETEIPASVFDEAKKIADETKQRIATSPVEKTPLKPIGEGETKTSKLSSSVAEKAVEKKLIDNFEGLPEYKTVNMKDQAKKATDLVNSDPTRAKAIAMGSEVPPADILPEAVFTAVENKAFEEGDVNTIRDLATASSLSTEATAMGQRLRALAERNPDSAVSMIQQVSKERQKQFKKNLKGKTATEAVNKTVDEIKQQVTKKLPKKQDWQSFIDSIQC